MADRTLARAPAMGGPWLSANPELSPWILHVITKLGFNRMTPVQASTIPRAMKNQDCVVEAVTGSGKTLAFVVPVLERLTRRTEPYKPGQIAAIVIAPTRELAQQIHDVFHLFLATLQPKEEDSTTSPGASSSRATTPLDSSKPLLPLPQLLTSGTKTPYDYFTTHHPQILIGTPGRLSAFLLSPRGKSSIKVSEFDALILDEADRLLSSPDHRKDVELIMGHLPKQRRTHLFSATMTDAVEEMVGIGLRNPVRIVVNLKDKKQGEEAKERRVPMGLQNTYLVCRHSEKTLQLVRLLQREAKVNETAKFIVYFSTCAAVDYFYRILSHLPVLSHFHLTSLHGDLPPRVRSTALSAFTSHPSSHLRPAVLLCTDVAARGVDFEDVDTVIQYDPPTDPKTFSHRAGRTARAGRTGRGVVLLGKGREEEYIEFLAARKIPLVQQPYISADLELIDLPSSPDPDAVKLQNQIRAIHMTDRELSDKAVKAFVSGLRAYTKHEASFIFRVADLDFHEMGVGYGLLRLPAMPEVRDWRKRREDRLRRAKEKGKEKVEDGEMGLEEVEEVEVEWEEADIDWNTYAYANKTRETARLATLAEKKARPPRMDDDQGTNKRKIRAELREAWSEQKEKKVKKEERRDKKDKRKQAEWEAKLAAGEEVGHVEAFKRARLEGDEVTAAYKALKREIKGEKGMKKVVELEEKGMFDDLD